MPGPAAPCARRRRRAAPRQHQRERDTEQRAEEQHHDHQRDQRHAGGEEHEIDAHVLRVLDHEADHVQRRDGERADDPVQALVGQIPDALQHSDNLTPRPSPARIRAGGARGRSRSAMRLSTRVLARRVLPGERGSEHADDHCLGVLERRGQWHERCLRRRHQAIQAGGPERRTGCVEAECAQELAPEVAVVAGDIPLLRQPGRP